MHTTWSQSTSPAGHLLPLGRNTHPKQHFWGKIGSWRALSKICTQSQRDYKKIIKGVFVHMYVCWRQKDSIHIWRLLRTNTWKQVEITVYPAQPSGFLTALKRFWAEFSFWHSSFSFIISKVVLTLLPCNSSDLHRSPKSFGFDYYQKRVFLKIIFSFHLVSLCSHMHWQLTTFQRI